MNPKLFPHSSPSPQPPTPACLLAPPHLDISQAHQPVGKGKMFLAQRQSGTVLEVV